MTRLWDPISGTPLVAALGRCERFDPSGRRLAFHQGPRAGIWEVAPGRECRQFRYGRIGNRMHGLASAAFDVDFGWNGRLLVGCGNDGVRLWDVAAGEEIGLLPIGLHDTAFFDAAGTRLFTYGRTGLRCWPVEADPTSSAARLRISPPRMYPVPGNSYGRGAALDGDERVLAVSDAKNHRVILLDLARMSQRSFLVQDWFVNNLDQSPDGRWLSLACEGKGVRVWDVPGNRPLEPLPVPMAEGRSARGWFSPDGRWFVLSRQDDYRAWRVGHWEEAPRVLPRGSPGFSSDALAFTRDSRLLAICRSAVEIQLIDLATFAEVARLLAPDAHRIECLRFSPDGGQLAASTQGRVIQLWDLRALRREFAALGLDWDLPPFPPAATASGRLQLALYPDLIEAEHLKPIAAQKCKWDMRDTSPRGVGTWSNDRELFGDTEKGGYLELALPVPHTGRYALGIWFTKGPDLGMVEVSLDGRRFGEPFDSFHEATVRSEKIDFGPIDLHEGRRRLRFTAVGKNPRATHHYLAVDCLELRPLDWPPRS